MLDEDELLNARFAAARPGLALLAIDDAALPVTVMKTEVLAQERKPLPLLNEFILRFADAGVLTIDEVAALTGLDAALVENAVADEVATGSLAYKPGQRALAMTAHGRRVFQELVAVQPVRQQLRVAFDRLTWSLADYGEYDLLSKKDATEQGMLLLPASRTARIGGEDITVPGINGLLKRAGQASVLEVLQILPKSLKPHVHRYLPVKALVYGDPDGGEVELSVVIDGEVSQRHDLALAEQGGAATLGVKVASPPARPELSADLEAQRVDVGATDLPAVEEVLRAGSNELTAGPTGGPLVRGVGVFEHRLLLEQALSTARRRLLVISPWVKLGVVDTAFIGRLEQRLRAGCVVHLAHGYGDDDSGSDRKALDRLANLQRRYKDTFSLVRLSNTHAKILIFDDTWISTSFNWLSFRGDPDRTYRMEEGTLVRIPEEVTNQYNRYLNLISEQRIDKH